MTASESNTRLALNSFLADVQVKAYRHALLATGHREDALDIVQDAMIRLAKSYPDKSQEWGALFHRILQNVIKDWYKKQSRKRGLFTAFFGVSGKDDGGSRENEDAASGLTEASDSPHQSISESSPSPEYALLNEQRFKKIFSVLNQLPDRQQQAFLLRAWWEKDVEETAFAMQCSTGSVKTHYHRAIHKLRELLGDKVLAEL